MNDLQINGLQFIDTQLKMPLMELPVRSTLVKLSNGQVLISPGSQMSLTQLQSLSPVSDIVAPNYLHTAGVPSALKVFPNAKAWGTKEGFRLTSQDWPYQEELKLFSIEGMPKVKEKVFIHQKSRTLIVADLFFNLQDPHGMGAWFILNLFGTYKKFGISRFLLKFVTDKKAFSASLKNLLNEDFENIVVGHGNLIKGHGKEFFKKALEERKLI